MRYLFCFLFSLIFLFINGKEKKSGNFKAQGAKENAYNEASAIADQQVTQAQKESEKKDHLNEYLEKDEVIQRLWLWIGGMVVFFIVLITLYRFHYLRIRNTLHLPGIRQSIDTRQHEIDSSESYFFARISHALRTPMTLILSSLVEIQKESRSDKQNQNIQLTKRNINRLLELVDQLADRSHSGSGNMRVQTRKGNPKALLNTLCVCFETLASQKQILFERTIVLDNNNLWYDEDKLEKIVIELLANAFKSTPVYGKVVFNVSIRKGTMGDSIVLVVLDSGKGIPQEEQELIFSPLYQSKISEMHGEGMVIGLSLVKELVTLCRGEIHLESNVNEGAMFLVTLPAGEEAFSNEQRIDVMQENQNLAEMSFIKDHFDKDEIEGSFEVRRDSILIVEDHDDMRNFMSSKLAKEYNVYTASNGNDGLSLAYELVPGLIISDLVMPGMDGITLIEKLRSDARTDHIPVILLTGRNETSSRIAGLKTGADDYLTKPFIMEELKARISNLIEQRKLLAVRFRERILVSPTPSNEYSMEDKFLQAAREIVEKQMNNFDFTVEQLSDEINLSRTQLLRKIKALTGLTPNEFIKDLRLKRAADLITQRADTITQIGYAVGFNDQSYFTKCFKKQFGLTPTDFAAKTYSENKPQHISE